MSCVTSYGGYFVCENVSSLRVALARAQQCTTCGAPFQRLNVFSTDFVVQDVSDLVGRDLFTGGTFVDTGQRVSTGNE